MQQNHNLVGFSAAEDTAYIARIILVDLNIR